MIKPSCKKLFKRWKLSEKEAFFGTTLVYEIQWLIKLERYFKSDEDDDMYDLIADLFWQFERNWQPISARQISYLYGVDHTTIDRILEKAKYIIKEQLHYQ